jgi:hypothetical protein
MGPLYLLGKLSYHYSLTFREEVFSETRHTPLRILMRETQGEEPLCSPTGIQHVAKVNRYARTGHAGLPLTKASGLASLPPATTMRGVARE